MCILKDWWSDERIENHTVRDGKNRGSRYTLERSRCSVCTHNPGDDIMVVGSGIYNDYKCQVNTYDKISVYKRDYGYLVPKSLTTPKTDCLEGNVSRSSKSEKQLSQQEMTSVSSAPSRPTGGRGGSRPLTTVSIV